jgi:cell wall-associated NlpC family hydrolase
MRTAPRAYRVPLSGSQACSIVSVTMLALLHPVAVAADATSLPPDASTVKMPVCREAPTDAPDPNHPATTMGSTDKPSGHLRKTRHRVTLRSATKSARRTAARRHDPGELIVPEGDGSPVLSIAANYLGRPYHFGSEGDAFDCSGFVRTVFADVGVDLPHSAREIATRGSRVARDELEPGDLVFFHNPGHRYATHVGIYVGDDKFVHASTHAGQVQVDSLSEAYYAQHYFCARRIEI